MTKMTTHSLFEKYIKAKFHGHALECASILKDEIMNNFNVFHRNTVRKLIDIPEEGSLFITYECFETLCLSTRSLTVLDVYSKLRIVWNHKLHELVLSETENKAKCINTMQQIVEILGDNLHDQGDEYVKSISVLR